MVLITYSSNTFGGVDNAGCSAEKRRTVQKPDQQPSPRLSCDCRRGAITAAAARLSMGKSGVSDVLKSLEVSLGVQLLTRTTRRQTLTSIVQKFYRQCRVLAIGTPAMNVVHCTK